MEAMMKDLTVEGQALEVGSLGEDFQHYLMQYAIGVILQRCTAGCTTEAEKTAARDKAKGRILRGELPSAGGRGSSLSDEDKALRYCLNKKLKQEKGEGLEAHLERVAKAVAAEQRAKFSEEITKKVRAHLEASDLYATKLAELRKAKQKLDFGGLSL